MTRHSMLVWCGACLFGIGGALDAQTGECPGGEAKHALEVRVVDRTGELPLVGVHVTVSWAKGQLAGETDASGSVVFCGLTPGSVATVAASVPSLGSELADVRIEPDGTATTLRLDLSSPSLSGGTARIVGVVRDVATSAPVHGVAVGTGRSGYQTVTTENGAFSLDVDGSGEVALRVRHLAYGERETTVVVPPGRVLEVDLRLESRPIEMEPLSVRIVGQRSLRLEIAGFYDRRRWMEELGLGTFLASSDIEERRAIMVSHLLADVPRVDFVRACPGSRCVLPVIAGTAPSCRGVSDTGDIGPSLYLDGHRLRPGAGVGGGARPMGIDEVVRPADVAGIEVYTGLSDLPGEFADANAQRCGAIVIWTGVR